MYHAQAKRVLLPLVWIVLALVLACTEHAPVYKSSFTGWLRSVWIPQRNVQDTLAILSQQRAHRRFLRCHPELHGLVRRYFRPHEKHGITPSAVTEGLEIARRFGRDRSLTLVQVLNGTIFLDDSHNKGMHRFERERLEFILDSLQTYLEGRARHCQSRRATLCSRDFEFLLDTKDCHVGWTTGSRQDPLLQRYARLPVLTMTRCAGRCSIPVVQWHRTRDGPFERWDEHRLTFVAQVRQSPYGMRQNKAVFRGTFRHFSSYDARGREVPTLIDDTNWLSLSRSRLQYLGWTRPDLLDVAVKVEASHRQIFEGYTNRLVSAHYMSTLEQALRFRHVIYVEGWCGWADRLKVLLLFNSTIFVQQTPCREYYQDLMKPYVHYVPVDGRFQRLESRIAWAQRRRRAAERIALNSLALAERYLSEDAMRCYMNMIFAKYSSLFRGDPHPRPHSVQWHALGE